MTTSKLKRIGLPALVVGGVAAGSLFAPIGIAAAQEVDPDAETTEAEETEAEETKERNGRRGHKGNFREVVRDTLGLTGEEIREARSEGQSLSDVADAQGVAVEDLADALVASIEAKVDNAVEEGKIDADKAAEIKDGLDEKVEAKLSRTAEDRADRADGEGRRGHGKKGNRGDRANSETVESNLEDANI